MRNKKTIIMLALALILAMALTFAACKKNDDPATDTTDNQEATTVAPSETTRPSGRKDNPTIDDDTEPEVTKTPVDPGLADVVEDNFD